MGTIAAKHHHFREAHAKTISQKAQNDYDICTIVGIGKSESSAPQAPALS
jgi:hypothetical protein